MAKKKSAKTPSKEVEVPRKETERLKKTAVSQKKPNQASRPSFPIVGIGASAGGLEALDAFFKAMPCDSGLGFVVVVHLDPTHVSILPELLQKQSGMPVRRVVDGMQVEPNHVYVIPPNKDLSILHGSLSLMDLPQLRGAKLPIDSFLRSLAQDQERNAVCIILSGTGTDGTLGVKAIKGATGMVMVQDEKSAKYEGMPRSAIATGMVDYVLPPSKMPQQLVKYTQYATGKTMPRMTPIESLVPSALQKIFVILRARTNHDFSLYKVNTICRRIERRMNVHQIDGIEDYVRYIQENETEAGVLFKELLIGVTNFFRDPEAFEVLQTETLVEILTDKPENYAVRVWIPGCASGEEAYSVAIVLYEYMERMGRHYHVQIFGTDLDEDAINIARAGLYPESIAADVCPERIKRFFSKEEDGQYRVKKVLREMLVFAPQNIIKDPPFTKLDLLCCRNLVIYLGPELQKKLLSVFHYSLKSKGVLFLGSSETVGQATDMFSPLHKKWKIYQRKSLSSVAHPILDFPVAPPARDLENPETVQKAEEISALQLVETILQQTETPPCVIINHASNIIYVHGRTGQFLEPAEGRASVNIVEMARPGLKAELAKAIRLVATHNQEVNHRSLQVQCNGGQLFVDLTVKPILEQIAVRGLMMVVFEETTPPSNVAKPKPKRTTVKRPKKTVEQLEQELRYSRENLQTTVEELETSNEELKSTNEELQSTNEELQSTNEELETSKEELQSLNEEAATVNNELQARMDELCKVHDDMKNLLDSTEIATVFLDTELRVQRFTPKATEIIPLTTSDVGRPINHLVSTLKDIDIVEHGRNVLTDLAVQEVDVASKDGRSYTMRVRPYRTVANVIEGVVFTFDETTQRKKLERAIRSELESELCRMARVFLDGADPIVMEDLNGSIVDLNTEAEHFYGWTREELTGRPINTLVPPNQRVLANALLEQCKTGGSVRNVKGLRQTKTGELVPVLLTLSLLTSDQGKPIGVATTSKDIANLNQESIGA